MKADVSRPCLSAVFVDYDNIYLSLKRKDDEVAKRFAKDATVWLEALALGHLITPTQGVSPTVERRLVMNRCYGNPAPRRNARDNSTDMFSFPFVRHHLLRAGFEIVDCPPLTQQLKNASDIRMVMDIRDYLLHETYFDEFIIISGDADFTPVLHRLRAHARRTVIYSNDYTATPFKAICDGEIREEDLMALLMQGELPVANPVTPAQPAVASEADKAQLRGQIVQEVVSAVRLADAPVPIETLADRAQRALGHERTSGSNWAGHGSFLAFLQANLPADIRLSDDAPYVARDMTREPAAPAPVVSAPAASVAQAPSAGTGLASNTASGAPVAPALQVVAGTQSSASANPAPPPPAPSAVAATAPNAMPPLPSAMINRVDLSAPAETAASAVPTSAPSAALGPRPLAPAIDEPAEAPRAGATPLSMPPLFGEPSANPAAGMPNGNPSVEQASAQTIAPTVAPAASDTMRPVARPFNMQASIARIHDASQAPPLGPPQYKSLFISMAEEISENGLSGAQTITNIVARSQSAGIEIRRDDVRFVLDVVSEADPWFEQGASATLFAGRFRNFVVARCRTQNLRLSAEELDLIEAWFAGGDPAAIGRGDSEGAADAAWREAEVAAQEAATSQVEPEQGTDMPRFVRAQ